MLWVAITVVVGLHLLYATMLKSKIVEKECTKAPPIWTSCVTDGKEPVARVVCSNLAKNKKWSQTFSAIFHFIIYTQFILLIDLSG